MTDALAVAVRLGLAAVVAVLVGWLDEPVTGHDLVWWVCALIGFVIVFGGWLIIMSADD